MFKFVTLLLIGPSILIGTAMADDPEFNIDGGPITTAGSLDVHIDWIDAAAVPRTVTLPPIPVAVGANSKTIRNAVQAALNANPTVKVDWTFKPGSAGLGAVQYTEAKAKAGVTAVHASIASTPLSGLAGLTASGGFTASINTPNTNWFAVLGTGGSTDQISLGLTTPADVNYTGIQVFSLPSCAGLDGDQIEQQLANRINQSGFGFSATIQDSRVYVHGVNTELGADWGISSAGGLQVVSGFGAVPEPLSMASLGCGIVALVARRRKRKS